MVDTDKNDNQYYIKKQEYVPSERVSKRDLYPERPKFSSVTYYDPNINSGGQRTITEIYLKNSIPIGLSSTKKTTFNGGSASQVEVIKEVFGTNQVNIMYVGWATKSRSPIQADGISYNETTIKDAFCNVKSSYSATAFLETLLNFTSDNTTVYNGSTGFYVRLSGSNGNLVKLPENNGDPAGNMPAGSIWYNASTGKVRVADATTHHDI